MSTTWIILLALTPVFIFDALLLFVILPRWIRSAWGPLAAAFPAREAAPDAVERQFQSISMGLLNFGYSFHITVDDAYLHLRPTRFARIFRITPVSIPWDQIRPTATGGIAAGQALHLPRWVRPLIVGEKAAS